MLRIVVLLLLALVMPGALVHAQNPGQVTPVDPKVGETFPDFSGKDISGNEVKLSDYKGKVLLIDFWATWCGPCLREMPHVIAAYKKYHDAGFEVVGISLDQDTRALDHFLKDPKTSLPWKTIYDGGGWGAELAQRFGIQSIPATFLLDREGKLVAKGLRGSALSSRVGRMLDPNAPPPLEELLPRFATSNDAQAGELMATIEASRKNASEEELGMGIAKALESPGVVPARAEFLMSLLPPDDGDLGADDLAYADLRALALYHTGKHADAATIQTRIVAAIDVIIDTQFPERYRESQRRSTGYTLPCVKLALYSAKAGDTEKARKLIEKVDAVPNKRSAEFFQSNQYYRQAKDLIGAAPTTTGEKAPT